MDVEMNMIYIFISDNRSRYHSMPSVFRGFPVSKNSENPALLPHILCGLSSKDSEEAGNDVSIM